MKNQVKQIYFLSITNLNFAGYTGSKNQVRNRKKTMFIQLDFSKIKCRLTGVLANIFFNNHEFISIFKGFLTAESKNCYNVDFIETFRKDCEIFATAGEQLSKG